MTINTGEKPSTDAVQVGGGSVGLGKTNDGSGINPPQQQSVQKPMQQPDIVESPSSVVATSSVSKDETVMNNVTNPSSSSTLEVVTSQQSTVSIPGQSESPVLSDSSTSFDIGGFDVGGISSVISEDPVTSSSEISVIPDTSPITVATDSQNTTQDAVIMNGAPISNATLVPNIEVLASEGVQSVNTLPEIQIQGIQEIQTQTNTLPESPLTTLMSGFGNTTEVSILNPKSDMSPQSPSVDQASLVDTVPPMDSIFSLTDTIPTGSSFPEVSPIVTEVNTESIGSAISSVGLSENVSVSENYPMNQVGKELARMTRSPRLQGKLTGFISELEELSQEEERIKVEKRRQIESYRIRIEELRKEYETRIHALELEEEDLKKQIAVMDEEKQHITQVIEGFKKELEVV